jgi:hypothetical protein
MEKQKMTTESNVPDFFEIPDVGAGVEPHAVDDGEYKVKLVGWGGGLNASGKPYIMPKFQIIEPKVVGAKLITMYLALPHAEMDEDETNRRNNEVKRCFNALGLPYPGKIDSKNDVGMEAWAFIAKVPDNSQFADEFGYGNKIKRWVK